MRHRSSLRHVALLVLCAVGAGLVAALAAGCLVGEDVAPPDASSQLHARFPEHATEVLSAPFDFAPGADGFAWSAPVDRAGSWSRVGIDLPASGAGTVRISAWGGFEVRVREIGVEGEGQRVERAVAFRRAGGTSFWAATDVGVEEWLHLEPGAAREGEAVAAWEIDGAALAQDGESVDLLDAQGNKRLRVSAPAAYAASGLAVKARLSAHDGRIELFVDAGEARGEALLVDPSWTSVANLITGRYSFTATTLQNGKVLAAGGANMVALKSVELWDPASNIWTPIAQMAQQRYSHTATLLQNGMVLVTGGVMAVPFKVAERYDPTTNLWLATPPMSFGRQAHTATLLLNGKVLVAGGNDAIVGGTVQMSAEVYDPVANSWVQTGLMNARHTLHAAALLQDGRVLLAGGYSVSGVVATAELYDPATNTWTLAAPMAAIRQYFTATTLANGKVLVAGGDQAPGTAIAGCELYDPATNTWSPTGSLLIPRRNHDAALLADGKVLVMGGSWTNNGTTAELYDPATGTWSAAPSMNSSRYAFPTTVLADGRVMVVGGYNGGPSASVEVYSATASIPCGAPADCANGLCVDGYCCDTACGNGDPSDCQACNVPGSTGVCTLLSASTTCRAAASQCDAPEQCTGSSAACPVDAFKPNGASCNDNSACTQTDTCQAGACVGGNPVMCAPLDQCHAAGMCDPATGVCSNPAKPNGALCNDGNPCTQTDTCQNGGCLGANPVVCAPLDQCHDAGVCSPATGVCSNPTSSDGTPCAGGTCQSGVCMPNGGTGGSGGSGGAGGSGSGSGSGGAGGSGSGSGGAGGSGSGTGGGGASGSGSGGGSASGSGSGSGSGGAGGSAATTSSSSSSGGAGSSGDPGDTSGCGCGVAGSRSGGVMSAGLVALLLLRRRRSGKRSGG